MEYAALARGDPFTVKSWAGDRWLARDFQGACQGGVIAPAAGTHVWEIH